MQITTNDLKNGYVLDVEGDLVSVVSFQHVKPGKGGAFVRTKLKSLTGGGVVDRTFRAGEKVERVTTEQKPMEFLYEDADGLVLMDKATYDQIVVAPESVDNRTCWRRTPTSRCSSYATGPSGSSCRPSSSSAWCAPTPG